MSEYTSVFETEGRFRVLKQVVKEDFDHLFYALRRTMYTLLELKELHNEV